MKKIEVGNSPLNIIKTDRVALYRNIKTRLKGLGSEDILYIKFSDLGDFKFSIKNKEDEDYAECKGCYRVKKTCFEMISEIDFGESKTDLIEENIFKCLERC